MRITTNQGEYFVSLPTRLFLDLKLICEKDSSISFDLTMLLTHLILNLKYADKGFKEGKEWVHLNAGILRTNYDTKLYKSKNHLEFLLENKVIEMKPHHHDPYGKKGYSRSYRIHQKYYTIDESVRTIFDSVFEMIPVIEPQLKRKFLKRIKNRKRHADLSAKHLTQWLNSNKFEFDTEEAIKYVDTEYPKSASEKIRRRNMKRMFFIKNFETALQIYSMEGKDGRLHTCFTYLPSDLKQFVKYDGKMLKEADIKSSQPFILTVLLELIINAYIEEIDRKRYITVQHFTKKLMRLLTKYTDININNFINLYKMCYYITNNVLINLQISDIEHIKEFIFLIRDGDIYEVLGEQLFESGAIWLESGIYYTKLKETDSNEQKVEGFDSLRKCAKTITLNAIYCSPKSNSVKAINEFRKLFPVVNNWLKALKNHHYPDLAILMQQMESKAVLHHSAKKLSEKHPKMPIISRHDSLSTTINFFDVLHSDYQTLLTDYFGVNVMLGEDDW